MEPKTARREQRKQKSAGYTGFYCIFSRNGNHGWVPSYLGDGVRGDLLFQNVGYGQLMLILFSQQPSGLRLPFWTGREWGQQTFRHLCFSFHKDKNIGFSIFLMFHPQKQFFNFIFFKNFIYVYNEIRSHLVSSFSPSHHITPNTLSSQLHVGFFFDSLLSTMSDAIRA